VGRALPGRTGRPEPRLRPAAAPARPQNRPAAPRPPSPRTPRGQAYVGAFLKKPDKLLAEEAAGRPAAAAAAGAAPSTAEAGAAEGAAAGAGAGEGGAAGSGEGGDAAGHLYEVGTFAQVHTILSGDTTDSAQLLLLGHRRLRREATVRAPGRGARA
jgi:hypothetical protein